MKNKFLWVKIIVNIRFKDNKSIRVMGRSTKQIKNRICNKFQADIREEAHYKCRVRYLPYKVEDVRGDWLWVDNEFEAYSYCGLCSQLETFASKDEVKFAQEYWNQIIIGTNDH